MRSLIFRGYRNFKYQQQQDDTEEKEKGSFISKVDQCMKVKEFKGICKLKIEGFNNRDWISR